MTRITSPALDAILGQEHPVLDHGFIRVVDYMGDDSAIVQAARVSYGEGTKAVSTDEGLIRYLMRRHHSTPFEMASIKLHVKLPIFVARQWIRHRTSSTNEISARYSILDREFYLPPPEHIAAQSTTNNQGRGDTLDIDEARKVRNTLYSSAMNAFDDYDNMLSQEGQQGVARELARMILPTSTYTQWYWKVDLHNLFHFLRLRADPHAQLEIRAYAETICRLIEPWVPAAYQAFLDYRLNAVTFSHQELRLLKELIARPQVDWKSAGSPALDAMSAREAREFVAKLDNLP